MSNQNAGVIDFGAAQANATQSNTQVKARHYLNIGVPNQRVDANGDIVDGRICLPYGLAIDTMPYMKGNSQMARDYNGMLDILKGIMQQLEDSFKEAGVNGGTKQLTGLQIFATIAADAELDRKDNQKDLESKLNIGFVA